MFIDFDHWRFAGFYQRGPRLERYVLDGWIGEFTDSANTYPDEVFPEEDRFWILGDRYFLQELNERGRSVEARREKSKIKKIAVGIKGRRDSANLNAS